MQVQVSNTQCHEPRYEHSAYRRAVHSCVYTACCAEGYLPLSQMCNRTLAGKLLELDQACSQSHPGRPALCISDSVEHMWGLIVTACACCLQVGIHGLQHLAAASVLQKLCLFNCKLAQEAAETLVSCLQEQGFSSLKELDLTGNEIEALQMQRLLDTLQQSGVAPALKVRPLYCMCLVLAMQKCFARKRCLHELHTRFADPHE